MPCFACACNQLPHHPSSCTHQGVTYSSRSKQAPLVYTCKRVLMSSMHIRMAYRSVVYAAILRFPRSAGF